MRCMARCQNRKGRQCSARVAEAEEGACAEGMVGLAEQSRVGEVKAAGEYRAGGLRRWRVGLWRWR